MITWTTSSVVFTRGAPRAAIEHGTLWLNYGDAYISGGRATYRSGASDNKGHQVQDDMPRPDTPNGFKPERPDDDAGIV